MNLSVLLGIVSFGLGLGLMVWFVYHSTLRRVGDFEKRYLEAATTEMNALIAFVSPQELILMSRFAAGLCFLLVLLATMGLGPIYAVILSGFVGYLVYQIPGLVVRLLAKRRMHLFHEQFADALTMIANASKTGSSLSKALSVVSSQMDAPIAEEFLSLSNDMDRGTGLKEAMNRLALRIPLEDVQIFSMVMKLTDAKGGNISEALDRLSTSVRARFLIHKKVKTITSEVKFAAIFVSLTPFGLYFLLNLVSPEIMEPINGTLVGLVVLIVVLVLQGIGGYMLWKITQIKY